MNQFVCPEIVSEKNKNLILEIFLKFLDNNYPKPKCELVFENPFQLLCATILSAQCTDKQVNKVTPLLFKKYPNPKSLAESKPEELEKIIYSTGFYKNKSKNLKAMATFIYEEYNSVLPASLDELIKLPGVGRKTANVLLGNAFGIPGLVVDTHVIRITNRMKFVNTKDPFKIELAMQKLLPESRWTNFSHQVILLGRQYCTARNPKCDLCPFHKVTE